MHESWWCRCSECGQGWIFSWLTDVGYKAAQFLQQLQKVFQWNYITISIMYSRCIKKPTVCNAHSQSYLLAMRQEDRRFASTIACTEKNSWNWVTQYQPHPICDFGGQPLQVHCLPPVKCTSLQGLQHSDRKKRKRRYSNTLFGIEWYNTKPIPFVTLMDNLCYRCKYTAYHLLLPPVKHITEGLQHSDRAQCLTGKKRNRWYSKHAF